MTVENALEAYFTEAASWDADRAAQRERSMRWLVATAAAGWLCAVGVSIALAMAMPLKSVQPFVIRVDNSTGIVDVVPAYTGGATVSEAVTRYFLEHYVSTCERFNFATAERDYEECGAFHTAAMNQAWYQRWMKSNPNSPLNLYRDGSSADIQVISVSFFTRASGLSDLAQVRYVKLLQPAGGGAPEPTHYIASIQYAYGKPPSDPRARLENPLGFKVLSFHSEVEVLRESAASTAATTASDSSNTAPQRVP